MNRIARIVLIAISAAVVLDAPVEAQPEPGLDYYLGFKAKGSRIANNELPKNWRIQLDDEQLVNPQPDDPENYEARKSRSLLNPATVNQELAPALPGLHYVRYQLKESRQGAGAAVGGRFPKAVKHSKRRWELSNLFGSITVDSSKVTALLVPAGASESGSATAPAQDRTHFECYKVKTAKNVIADQTPESAPGSGRTRFLKTLQAYVEDTFAECGADTTFSGSAVEGMCLFDLKKPVELCNPATKSAVGGGRTTSATITGSTPEFLDSLLCYQARLSSRIKDPTIATLGNVAFGQRISRLQSKHVKRRLKDGTAVATAPGNLFPAPTAMDTTKVETLCVPTLLFSVVDL